MQVAPVIHEWTYDAMCHDLLDLDGNNYTYEVFDASTQSLYITTLFYIS
jgi:hypothetical protein